MCNPAAGMPECWSSGGVREGRVERVGEVSREFFAWLYYKYNGYSTTNINHFKIILNE
jgi:hypothetical protein